MVAMRQALRFAVPLVLLFIVACASAGPPYGAAENTIPPVPSTMARIFLYRWLEPYDSTDPAIAYFNGKEVAVSRPGSVLYRDVAPGRYTVSIFSRGRYPDQFKTVVLRPGETAYARIESAQSWQPCGGSGKAGTEGCDMTFVVVFVSPVVAQDEIRDLAFIHG